jgi:hypothetical protein
MVCAFAVATAWASDGPGAEAGTDWAAADAGPAVVADGVSAIPGTFPVSPDAKVHRVSIIGDTVVEEGTVSGTGAACHETQDAAYCNTLSNTVFGPEGANTRFADDITLAAVAGCRLDRYVIRVTGDRQQDGTGQGDYTVKFGLYETCPGASAVAPILGSNSQVTVPAAQAGDIYEITFIPSLVVNLPSSVYLGVSFSRAECGVVLGAPPLLGTSADRFDFPGFACSAGLGGYPDAPHASFYAEIYTLGECARSFAAYKNTNDAGNAFSAGARLYFADDVQLEVPDCRMVAFEVGHKNNGFVRVDLHTYLDNADPGGGGLIPGTRIDCFSSGSNPQICRKEFDPPIPLVSPNFWVMFRTSSGSMGPILTCKDAVPGSTEDIYMVHRDGVWGAPLSFGGQCWSGFEFTVYCEGQPPAGSCCDMIMVDEEGDSVCRDGLPEFNCPFPELWEQGAVCASVCEGGTADGEPCTRQVDCPLGECPGPLPHPCGVAACCKPDGECDNLTSNQCDAIPPVDSPRLFQLGRFCSEQGQRCPFPACLLRTGECTLPRPAWCVGGSRDGELCDFYAFPSECPGYTCVGGTDDGEICDPNATTPCGGGGVCTRAQCVGEVGCEDPFCCTDVCSDPINTFCCTTYWDELCASEAFRLCERPPSNDECYHPDAIKGARLIDIPSVVESDGIQATTGATDPDFCCYEPPQGGLGPVRSVWYKFEAPANGRCDGGDRNGAFCDPNAADPENPTDGCPGGVCDALPVSVSLDTCCSNSRPGGPADDSLLQVFALADPDRGVCEDGLTVCSISADDCPGGGACTFDEEWGCANLLPIACSDDAGTSCVCGAVDREQNSRVCVEDLNPGQMYYVMVSAKTIDNVGVWQIRSGSPCSNPKPSQDNDLCFNGMPLSGQNVELEFDLGGGLTNAPATLDCPEPPPSPVCMDTMKADLWYDWTAPCNGTVTIETCGGSDALTPDSSLVVYEGCDCPVDLPMESAPGIYACSDFLPSPCFLGSGLYNLPVEEGMCYKIRLGGSVTDPVEDSPAGPLKIDCTCVSCPVGPVNFVNPPDGMVDARQPHPPDDAGVLQGEQVFLVEAPSGASPDCWSFCDSDDTTENDIASIVDNGDDTYTVTLVNPMPAAHVTTITYTDDAATEHRGVFIAHPANVNGDSSAAPADILVIIDCLNAVAVCETHQCDVDRSGVCGPPDILRVIDLLNGAGAYDSWLNSPAPVCDETNCCPP